MKVGAPAPAARGVDSSVPSGRDALPTAGEKGAKVAEVRGGGGGAAMKVGARGPWRRLLRSKRKSRAANNRWPARPWRRGTSP
jgi:hypothetical protein